MVDDERLGAEVSRYTFLYNHDVTNKVPGQNREAWENIAQLFGYCTSEECKQRWRTLRDTYVRYYKKSLKNPGQCIPWRLYQQMTFLTPYILTCKRNRYFGRSVFQQEEVDPEDTEEMEDASDTLQGDSFHDPDNQGTSFSELGSDEGNSPDLVIESVVGRHIDNNQNYNRLLSSFQGVPSAVQSPQLTVPVHDEAELYLLSLPPALRHLTPRNRARAQIRIETLMEELEFGEVEVKGQVRVIDGEK